MRSRSASGENPPNTTECTAPMRAHASIATAASGTIGMYTHTRSPLPTPFDFSTLANRHTSACSSRNVMRLSSPGVSPSHSSAGLSPRASRCRSRQL